MNIRTKNEDNCQNHICPTDSHSNCWLKVNKSIGVPQGVDLLFALINPFIMGKQKSLNLVDQLHRYCTPSRMPDWVWWPQVMCHSHITKKIWIFLMLLTTLIIIFLQKKTFENNYIFKKLFHKKYWILKYLFLS